MSIAQTLMAGYANPMIVVDSAEFTLATPDYMTRGANLTGCVDSKSGTLLVYVRFDTGTLEQRIISNHSAPHFEVNRATTSGRFEIIGTNAAGTNILVLPTTATFAAAAAWHSFLASWDLATGAAHLYVDNVSDVGTTTLTNDTIDYAVTGANWSVGANSVGNLPFGGCFAELWFTPGVYIDFSNVYNRRKFVSASGKPVHLGTTGALPTGTAPIVYHHLDDAEAVANFATNRGTGGNFTITGTLATGSTSPSD